MVQRIEPEQLQISSLGESTIESPLKFDSPSHAREAHFVRDSDRISHSLYAGDTTEGSALSYEEAGPRERIFFKPETTRAAVVTCGGLSPGLNNVIRSLYYELTENYGVQEVLGIRNGYAGLNPENGLEPLRLTESLVDPIDKIGGTILGTSRGAQRPEVVVDTLQALNVDVLFCLGGDGTQRGAESIHREVSKRQLRLSVIGIPKTIDNDIPFVRLSFGYVTALERASEVITCAHVEARDAINGVGLVKLMGRHAGFIAAGASVVSQDVNFTLIPEIEFPLEGPQGLLPTLQSRLEKKKHAVIVVAEGAGQHLFDKSNEQRDASGNRLSHDIGELLRENIQRHFKTIGVPIAMKYMDPSYAIRSVPADGYDRFICDHMARHAVHAGMAGKTGMMIGQEHNKFIHVPISTVVAQKKTIDVTGDLWRSVLLSTGQPRW